MRDNFIPCVPPEVDAFLLPATWLWFFTSVRFIDDVGLERYGSAIDKWREQGWHIRHTAQRPGALSEALKRQPFQGTKYVSGPRITTKSLTLSSFLVGTRKGR